MTHTCKNCSNNFKGDFCNQCGQKYNVSGFTFKHFFEEAFPAFTHADKGVLVLVKALC